MIIRDPAAILPLMGATGWGKSAGELIETSGGQFPDVSFSAWPASVLCPPIPSLIIIRDGPEHARRRRTWNRGFNAVAIKQYEPLVHKRVAQLSEVLVQRGCVDLAELFDYFAFVSSFIVYQKLITSKTDSTSWRTWGKYF